MTGSVCPGCNTIHPDLNLPKGEPLAMDSTTTAFEIRRNDWFEILDDVLPFAGDDPFELPLLQNVEVRVSESGLITSAATDRFTVGRRVYQLPDHKGEPVTILVPLAAIKDLRRIHASMPRGSVKNDIAVQIKGSLPSAGDEPASGGVITVTSRGGRVTSTHDGFVGDFVSVDKLIAATDSTGFRAGVDRIAWNPEYMARFAKVKGAGSNTVVQFQSPSRPIRIDIGDQFTGLIMPARLPRDSVAS